MAHSFYYTLDQLSWVEDHYTDIRILAADSDGYIVVVWASAPEDLLLYLI